MAVAVAALIVALSGTALAAITLVNGDKLIKKNSLSGNRLRNHTVTRKQISLSKLGKVPSASQADRATNATSANHASSADSATNANHASSADSATAAGQAATAVSASNADAVAGNAVKKVFFHEAAGAAPVQVYSADGLVITAGCNDTGNRVLALATGDTPQNAAQLAFHVVGDGTGVLYDEEPGPLGTSVHGLTASHTRGSGLLDYSTPDRHVVTMTYGFSSHDLPDGGCTFSGIAIASS